MNIKKFKVGDLCYIIDGGECYGIDTPWDLGPDPDLADDGFFEPVLVVECVTQLGDFYENVYVIEHPYGTSKIAEKGLILATPESSLKMAVRQIEKEIGLNLL